MEITVNQQTYSVSETCSVQHMLSVVLQHAVKGFAVAVNQVIISKNEWESHLLNPGDQIILVKATQGG